MRKMSRNSKRKSSKVDFIPKFNFIYRKINESYKDVFSYDNYVVITFKSTGIYKLKDILYEIGTNASK